jgi:hypothetical protein
LYINYGEDKEEVIKNGVQHYIDSGVYMRNKYGVLLKKADIPAEDMPKKDPETAPEIVPETAPIEPAAAVEAPKVEEVAPTTTEEVVDETKEPTVDPTDGIDEGEVIEMADAPIEMLRELYKSKMGKNAPSKRLNDREWLISQI